MGKEQENRPILPVTRKEDFIMWLLANKGCFLPLGFMTWVLSTACSNYVLESGIFTQESGAYKSFGGVAIYALGRIVDYASTERVVESIGKLNKVGFQSPYVEQNPLVYDKSRGINYSLKYRIGQSVVAALAVIIPPIGIGYGLFSLLAAFNNERVRAFHERKLAEVLTT